MRTFRAAVVILLVLGANAFGQHSVPQPLEANECEATRPNELPRDRFKRSGGRTIDAKVQYLDGVLTIPDVEQGRDLSQYETLVLRNPKPMSIAEMNTDPVLGRARTFLWQHWRDHKPAYLIFTGSSVDATSTSHVFVEQDDARRWRVSWRIVRGFRLHRVDDLPTSYSVDWVIPAGFRKPGNPLPKGQEPDAVKNRLELRDKCGEFHQF